MISHNLEWKIWNIFRRFNINNKTNRHTETRWWRQCGWVLTETHGINKVDEVRHPGEDGGQFILVAPARWAVTDNTVNSPDSIDQTAQWASRVALQRVRKQSHVQHDERSRHKQHCLSSSEEQINVLLIPNNEMLWITNVSLTANRWVLVFHLTARNDSIPSGTNHVLQGNAAPPVRLGADRVRHHRDGHLLKDIWHNGAWCVCKQRGGTNVS